MTPPDAVEVDKVDKLNQIPDTPALARKRLFLGVGLMLTMFGLVCFMLAFYNYRASQPFSIPSHLWASVPLPPPCLA
jgi:quinol-cytochrome oxidoreductase complex cytochrome b subunit